MKIKILCGEKKTVVPSNSHGNMRMKMRVCVCERERERETNSKYVVALISTLCRHKEYRSTNHVYKQHVFKQIKWNGKENLESEQIHTIFYYYGFILFSFLSFFVFFFFTFFL